MKIVEIKDRSEIIERFGQSSKYYRLTGRLANQMLGLSDAHAIGRVFKCHMVVDVTTITRDEGVIPEWAAFIEKWDWLTLIKCESIDSCVPSSELWDSSNATKNGLYLDTFGYTGFSVSLDNLLKSGLYKRGSFPFEVNVDEVSQRDEDCAISIRGGDYLAFPTLGLLPKGYYKRALMRLKLTNDHNCRVFTDDENRARKMMRKLKIKNYEFDKEPSPVKAMYNLSKHRQIVMANSTFSYLSCFFSSAEIIVSPSPFYLAEPDWNKRLRLENEVPVDSFKHPKISFTLLRVRKRIKK